MSLDDLRIEEIRAYAARARDFLKMRIDFDYEYVEMPTEDGARALRYWAILLGVLAHEVSGSAILLSETVGHERTISILNRVLFEYWVRLKYYRERPADAALDLGKARGRFKAISDAFPAQYAERKLDRADLEQALRGSTQRSVVFVASKTC